MIRSTLLAAASTLVLASVAIAADLPSEKGPPVYAPPPPPVFSWTGFYIGGQIGYEWGQTGAPLVFTAPPNVFYSGANHSDAGVVGGLHLGYNYQISQFVVGIEGDVNGSSYRGAGALGNTPNATDRTSIPVDGSVRGRVGVAFDRALVYATGGAAFASIHNSFINPNLANDFATTGRVGWTVGAGVEYAIDNNWSLRAEYRYTDYGAFSYPLINGSTPSGILTLRAHETDNRVQAGFSYKFGDVVPPAPPVVAKY